VKKVSLKLLIVVSLLFGAFYACVDPVNVTMFFESPEVKIIVETADANKKPVTPPGSVILAEGSEGTAGDGSISGLASGEYYRLEETSEAGVKINLFVQADGGVWGDLSSIGRLTGNQITGLINNYKYKVIKAGKFTDTGTHKYFEWNDASPQPLATITNGDITIPGMGEYFFDLVPIIDNNKDYEVRKIAISGTGNDSWNDSRTSARLNSGLSTIVSKPNSTSSYYNKPDIPGKTLIGIFQYVGYTGPTPLIPGTSLIELEGINTESEYVFAEYTGNDVSKFIVLKIKRVAANQTPVVGDYTIGNLAQTYGNVSAVTVTVNSGKSPGTVTVYYQGTNDTTYAKSTTLPGNAGDYAVTFDVAAATGWNAVTGLTAGTLTISKAIPAVGDYTIGNLAQTYGNPIVAVTITVTSGKSDGATSNIRYNGSPTLPTDAGTYPVTFDVAGTANWEAATLSAGNLIISKATPVAGDFTFGKLSQVAGSVTAVTITANPGKSTGAITIKYNGSTTIPQAAGNYTVTFDVEDDTNWLAATLSAGTLVVIPNTVAVDVSGLTNAFTGHGIVPNITGTATYSQSSASITITLTVTNGTNYSSFEWRGENGSVLTTTATQTVTGQGTASITIVAAQADASNWYQAGTHIITLIVTEKESGVKLSGTGTITCNP
jgi:hypothetical protein